jgi:hypothetical protein
MNCLIRRLSTIETSLGLPGCDPIDVFLKGIPDGCACRTCTTARIPLEDAERVRAGMDLAGLLGVAVEDLPEALP